MSYVNGGSGGGVSGASAECNTWQQMEVGNVGCGSTFSILKMAANELNCSGKHFEDVLIGIGLIFIL